jgi:hypothetical protein
MRVVLALLLAGCLTGSYNGQDMQQQQQAHDMAAPLSPPTDLLMQFNLDLTGLDLYGLSNCPALNKCEQNATPAQALTCQTNATPTALAKEALLQSCFKQWCPVVADMGLARCAANDMGAVSSDCQTCINNSYVTMGQACTPANAPECHMCLGQAQICLLDQ